MKIREFPPSVLLLFAALTAVIGCGGPGRGTADLTRYVDPMIGTNGHGHTYPGPLVPFGMVQLSPDVKTTDWDWCSGYHYSSPTIMGFSHTHLSGTGCADYGDILFMPTTAQGQH
jgi:Putative alpha-1,2-mannosidase